MKDHCGRRECTPCETKPGFCKVPNVTYSIECQECTKMGRKAQYIGENCRTFYDRALDHKRALLSQNSTYGVVRHWMDHHPNMKDPPTYSFKLLKRHQSCLERQIHEALAIENMTPDFTMNEKSEWGRNKIPRLHNLSLRSS